ncbi:Putative protein [Zobellia galactanivorans]|uniref:Uncharacterized protein n=1 Tax=Zobellia galactanivorans (strain DSM 12802 / CCUG 47099 / CIP 106680 / NCIMB 13871 / Dsij) TaxID=63186 RepID=G0L0H1_ZOBGA|nr:Putative protein [Zobellia galactanivorans]
MFTFLRGRVLISVKSIQKQQVMKARTYVIAIAFLLIGASVNAQFWKKSP